MFNKIKWFFAKAIVKFLQKVCLKKNFVQEFLKNSPEIANDFYGKFLPGFQTFIVNSNNKSVEITDFYTALLPEFQDFIIRCGANSLETADFYTGLLPEFQEFIIKSGSDFPFTNRFYKSIYPGIYDYLQSSAGEFWNSGIKNTQLGDDIYLLSARKSGYVFGALDNSTIYEQDKTMVISGWLYPVSNYDAIEIYADDDYIGEAVIGLYHGAAFKKYPNIADPYVGWKLTHHTDVPVSKVQIRVVSKGQVVRVYNTNIKCSDASNTKSDVQKSRKKLLEISENGDVVSSINLHQLALSWKKLKHLLTNKVSPENDYIVKLSTEHQVVCEQPLKVSEKTYLENQEILANCNSSSEFYNKYMSYTNWTRIYSDFEFIDSVFCDKKDIRILDMGAAPPMFLYLLKKNKYNNISAVDPAIEDFAEYFTNNNIDYYKGNILTDNLDFQQSFDLVLFTEVIEHLTGNILAAIEKISSYVADNGFLYVTTPNLSSISGLLGLYHYDSGLASKYYESVYQQYGYFDKTGYYGHVREYTSKEVIQLFEQMGFRLVEFRAAAEHRLGRNSLVGVLEKMFNNKGIWGKYLFQKI